MDIFEDLRLLRERLGREPVISLFGFGGTSRSLYSALMAQSFRSFTVRSDGDVSVPKGVIRHIGEDARRDIYEDAVLFSPSVRREGTDFDAALARGCLFSSDCELFFSRERGTVFAVSGSDGKSTTVAMAAELLSESFPGVTPSCNFGTAFSALPPCSGYCAELSSFNLLYLDPRVKRGLVTNITPNHLDIHKDYEEYMGAKLKLLQGAEEPVICYDDGVLQRACPHCYAAYSVRSSLDEMRASLSAQVYYTLENGFIKRNGERLIREEEIGIEGIYARQNLLGALALTDGYATPDGQREVARSFTALPHRCTVTVSPSGRRFIDSSIDTTPSRTAATLRSLDRRVGIILGGRGKGLSPEPLVEPLAQFAEVIGIYGEWGEELYGYLRPRLKGAVIERVDRMAEAVDIAVAGCSSDVLLSPAATSYGEFTDYRQRGEFFTEYVKKYYFT